MHENIFGESREEIIEALREVRAMAGLSSALTEREVHDMGVYLRTRSNERDKEDEWEENKERIREKSGEDEREIARDKL